MIDNNSSQETLWEKGWNGHKKAQLMRMARLPLRDKIKWLEEAQEVLLHVSGKEEDKTAVD